MGIVMVNAAVSVDGYIAGPNHEMDWVFDHQFLPDQPVPVIEEVILSTGAVLAGRSSHDVGQASSREETRGAFGGRWAGPEFILTHSPPEDLRTGTSYLSGDIGPAVATALEAAGGKNLLVLGANVAQQCLGADLVDEILLFVLPIVLGDGVRLFGRPGYREVLFDLATATQIGQAAVLHFRRRRSPSQP